MSTYIKNNTNYRCSSLISACIYTKKRGTYRIVIPKSTQIHDICTRFWAAFTPKSRVLIPEARPYLYQNKVKVMYRITPNIQPDFGVNIYTKILV
jgi:hypothetical protein